MKHIIIILALLCLAGPAYGAVVINSEESGATGHRGTTSGTALTWSFNNVSGTLLEICVVVTNAADGSADVSISAGPTYDGVSMILATSTTWSNGRDLVAIYYLANPHTGNKTVSVTGSASSPSKFAILAGAISFTGANLSSPIGTVSSGSASSGTHATINPAITSTVGNYLLSCGGWGSGEGGTADSGQVTTFLLNGTNFTAGDDIIAETKASNGSAVTMGYTWGVSDQWAIVTNEIKIAPPTVFVKIRGKVKVRGGSGATTIARISGQGTGNHINNEASPAILDVAFPGNVTAGNDILVFPGIYSVSSTDEAYSLSQSAGTATIGAFTEDKQIKFNGNQALIAISRAHVTGTGSLTVRLTATASSNIYIAYGINEYSGMATGPVYGTPDSNSGTGTLESTNAITAFGSGGLIAQISAEASDNDFSYTQSDTNIFKDSTGSLDMTLQSQDKLTSGTGPYTLTADTANSWPWASIAVVYKPANVANIKFR